MSDESTKRVTEAQSIQSNFIDAIQSHAQTAISIGVISLLCGLLAVAAPFVAGVSITIVVGLLLLTAGIAQCFIAFKADGFGRGLLVLLVGALTAIAGGFMLGQPREGLEAITLFLAIYFMVTGIVELIAAMQIRPTRGWGWLLFNGVVTLALGAIIWGQYPVSGIWAVGTLFGIKLMMSGWWLIVIGRSVRKATAT